MTRLFFTTDVHASDRCFRKFLNAAKVYGADSLILGGDITGKVLVPVVDLGDGRYRTAVFGKERTFGRDRLVETRKELQDAGQYSFVASPSEVEELRKDKAKEDAAFNAQVESLLSSWLALAEERLKGTQKTCYISPGNDDRFEVDRLLVDSGHVVNPEGRVVDIGDGHEMITLGYANPTPWKSPREAPEERVREMIEVMASRVKDGTRAVYNLHVPPLDTELDRAPAVSADFDYVREGLGVKLVHAGSSAVREEIEVHSPLLGLHGHIHESKGFAYLGRTLCLNPGSEYSDGILRGALVNLEGGRVKDFLLTNG
jgi:uncharacterized protein